MGQGRQVLQETAAGSRRANGRVLYRHGQLGKLEGQSGDWLIQYDEAGRDFGIVGQAIFDRTYRRLPMTAELQAKLAAMRARVPNR